MWAAGRRSKRLAVLLEEGLRCFAAGQPCRSDVGLPARWAASLPRTGSDAPHPCQPFCATAWRGFSSESEGSRGKPFAGGPLGERPGAGTGGSGEGDGESEGGIRPSELTTSEQTERRQDAAHSLNGNSEPRGQAKPQGGGLMAGPRRFLRDLMQNERMLAISGSTALMAMCHTALGPVLPIFAKEFDVSMAAVGTTVSAFAIARLLLNLPSGIVADRIGRRPLLVIGPGHHGAGALQMSGSTLFLADMSTRENRAKTLGTNQVAGLLGVSLGPAVGGLLADAYGLRAPFLAVGCASLLASVYAYARLPETHPVLLRRQAEGGTTSVASPSVADICGHPLSETQVESGAGEQGTRTEPPAPAPSWRSLLASCDFQAICIVNCVLFMTVNGTRAVLMPLLGVEAFGFTPSMLGLMFASMAAINVVGVIPAANLADSRGRKKTIVPACVGLAASLGLMACTSTLGPEAFWASALVFAVMNSMVGPTPAAYAADVIPKRSRGLGLGLYRSAGDLGLLLGPPMLGAVADMTTVNAAMATNAAMIGAAALVFARRAHEIQPRRPTTPPHQPPG
eukprot:jgi/Tetstr1/444988/TSEL_032797.t1